MAKKLNAKSSSQAKNDSLSTNNKGKAKHKRVVKYKPLTKEREAILREYARLYDADIPHDDIAKIMKVSRSTVGDRINECKHFKIITQNKHIGRKVEDVFVSVNKEEKEKNPEKYLLHETIYNMIKQEIESDAIRLMIRKEIQDMILK